MDVTYSVLSPAQAVSFHRRLGEIRTLYLGEALGQTVAGLDIPTLDAELSLFVPPVALARLASYGLRGELFFPVPLVLRANPFLLGYYRLLFGISQKAFYQSNAFGTFSAMEGRGVLRPVLEPLLPQLCTSLCQTAEQLVDGLTELSPHVVYELQLLALGPQFKGGENNVTGTEAMTRFSALIGSIVEPYVQSRTARLLVLHDAAGHEVQIAFASDPDVDIRRVVGDTSIPLLAIEVKGGGDSSNKHNRLGEAEKSH